MKFILYISIALLSLTSCKKEAFIEAPTTETSVAQNTTKTLISYSTADAVTSFINGKWAWKETVVKTRAGQTQSSPSSSGVQKEIILNGQGVTVFENGVKTVTENYTLKQTEKGWWFEGGNCSGILYRVGDQLIIVGSVVDKADDYYQRAR
jgi:hypothetical protein